MIYASSLNHVIGQNNRLPWRLPTDLRTFKEKTLHQIVVMGRKTFESLPKSFTPLPLRTNAIVSRSYPYMKFRDDSIIIVNDLKKFLEANKDSDKEIWIMGGCEIYKQSIDYVKEIHHTLVNITVDGDAFFNIEDHPEFKLKSTVRHFHQEDNGLTYSVNIYRREE